MPSCHPFTPHTTRAGGKLTAMLALALIGSPVSAATEYCWTGNWDAGNGYSLDNWFADGWDSSKGWACAELKSSTSFIVRWDITSYGFLHQLGRKTFWKSVDASSSSATAYFSLSVNAQRGKAFTGCYGWLAQPNTEWYIIENWFTAAPNPGSSNLKGSITVDGATYDIYNVIKPNGQNFDQWWSIRRSKRTSGNVSYVQHFKKWRQLGMANLMVYNVMFQVEPEPGSSKGEVSYWSVSVNAP